LKIQLDQKKSNKFVRHFNCTMKKGVVVMIVW